MKLLIGLYELDIPEAIEHETFSCEDYHGVTFVVGGVKYDVLHNRHMGERLLIAEAFGWLKDMPFHPGTARFLPAGVTVMLKAPSEVAGKGSYAAEEPTG